MSQAVAPRLRAVAGRAPASAAADAGLGLHALACERGGRPLFTGLSATVPPGGLLQVEGPNGAGKTSLLRLVCGLSAPAAGEVRWNGWPVTTDRERFHAQLLYLGHAPALKDDLSAVDNLRAAAGLTAQACDLPRALAALRAIGLGGRERLPCRSLSQGQRRRVGLARLALAPTPLWVLDEPFDALDEDAATWLQNRIERHLQSAGVVVLTSHQPRDWGAAVARQRLVLGRHSMSPVQEASA